MIVGKNQHTIKILIFLMLFWGLTSCSQQATFAPVVERSWSEPLQKNSHRVNANETLYAIAAHYHISFHRLIALNHLQYPYAIHTGQRLRLKKQLLIAKPTLGVKSYIVPTHKKPSNTTVKISKKPLFYTKHTLDYVFIWPTTGRVVSYFMPYQGKKGINIAGRKGALIKAAASGVVAYAGSGLSGYGNLIIIKHSQGYLTAYGNNLRNRVVEGQHVKAGQTIADIGIIDRAFWGVHFEIRKAGQPVDPRLYLSHQ